MTILDIGPADERAALHQRLKDRAAAPELLDTANPGLWRHRKKDGTWLDVEVTWSGVSFQGRQTTLALADDITGRVHAESALKSRARYQAVAAHLGMVAMTHRDMDLFLTEAATLAAQALETEYCKILELLPDGKAFLLRAGVGWKKGVVGHLVLPAGNRSLASFTLTSDKPVLIDDLRKETRFDILPMLQEHGIRSAMSVTVYGGAKVYGILSVHSDRPRSFTADDAHFLRVVANILTTAMNRKASDEIFRRQAALLDLAHDSIIVRALNDTIQFWNRGAERMYGWKSSEVLGKHSHELLQTNFPKPLADIEADLYRHDRWRGELSHTKRDGTSAVIAARWALQRNDRGEPVAILEISNDVTQEKTREQERIRLYEEANKKREEAETFAAWIQDLAGLPGMKERAKLLNGHFRVDSAPGRGTRVTVRFPIMEGGKEKASA